MQQLFGVSERPHLKADGMGLVESLEFLGYRSRSQRPSAILADHVSRLVPVQEPSGRGNRIGGYHVQPGFDLFVIGPAKVEPVHGLFQAGIERLAAFQQARALQGINDAVALSQPHGPSQPFGDPIGRCADEIAEQSVERI